jgi:3-oxoacyl-[acyl-carrier protein] reductase
VTGPALVTGAGRGIGFAVAQALAAAGHAVAVNDRDAEVAERAAAALTASGARAVAVAADVADEGDVERMLAETRAALGDPEVLVNNAGFTQHRRLVDLSTDDFDRMIAVHLRGTFLCTRGVLPAMLAREHGVIVNVASQMGQIGGTDLTHYAAAKAGVIGMTKALAREVSSSGVRVNAVAPGPVDTELLQLRSAEWRAAAAARLPLGRIGLPEEVAAAVAFLCSDAAALFVGQTLGPNAGDVML